MTSDLGFTMATAYIPAVILAPLGRRCRASEYQLGHAHYFDVSTDTVALLTTKKNV